MAQSDILCGLVQKINDSLNNIEKEPECEISLLVNDICQSELDKSGQKVIVDEQQYEQPANFELCIAVVVSGTDLYGVLRTYGRTAAYFKDNSSIDTREWNWHGSMSDKVYLEPVIRHVDVERKNKPNGVHSLELLFKTEICINSQKPTGFKRVERRDIRGYVKK